ncbi:MAG: hypothetical protein H7257_14510 [Taibaiella sp.]|nr:hypothetical protein [Taibaiella sp.]
MKRTLLAVLLIFGSLQGFSYSLTGIFAGAGLATRHNYDVGIGFGAYYLKTLNSRIGIGLTAFSQQYNLYYDNENDNIIGGSIRHKSNYAFAAPLMQVALGKKGSTDFYVNAGVGFNVGVSDTLRKWSRSPYGGVAYDSVIDQAKGINSMVTRIGFGFTEFLPMTKHLYFTFTEDFGFLPSQLSKADDPTNATLHRNVATFFKPTYISFRIGICFLK